MLQASCRENSPAGKATGSGMGPSTEWLTAREPTYSCCFMWCCACKPSFPIADQITSSHTLCQMLKNLYDVSACANAWCAAVHSCQEALRVQCLVHTWTRPAVKSRSGMAMRANTTVISSTRGTGRCRQLAGCFAPAGGTCCPASRQGRCQQYSKDKIRQQTHQTTQGQLNMAILAQ